MKARTVGEGDCLRCDDCGLEIHVAAIVEPDGAAACSAEQYLDRLHAAGYGLFCEVCISGRTVAWQLAPWEPPADHAPQVTGQ